MEHAVKRFLRITISEICGTYLKLFKKNLVNEALTVFNYHDVTSNPSIFSFRHDLNVPPNIFENQLEFIKDNFNVISPDDLLQDKIPRKAALITFDDGFSSYFTTAVPILTKYNMPSINFLNMGVINGKLFLPGIISYLATNSSEFKIFISQKLGYKTKNTPLYVHCTREIVELFFKFKRYDYNIEVKKHVGAFATEKVLQSMALNNLVYFGNHLYNHDVSKLLSDTLLLKSYNKNEDELKRYPNYRKLFAFPFGQPGSSYTKSQIDLLLENGANKVFSTHPVINYDVNDKYLNRIPLHSFNNTNSRIWFNILRRKPSLSNYTVML